MKLSRRSALKLFGGASAGLMISPLPWKLLDDVSIWTQNWSLIARPPRGPVTWRHTTCTLCPGGCGLRLRLVGGSPVSAWAVVGHPVSAGTVCPMGLGAAQVRFHPARIRGAVQRGAGRGTGAQWRLVSGDDVVRRAGSRLAGLRDRGAAERSAILDLCPGRSLSVVYDEFLRTAGGGRYLTLPDGRVAAADALADLIDLPDAAPGYDFARAGAVISFGAPLLDGWQGAGAAPGLLPGRDDARTPFLIQVESNGSTTANRADRWIPIRPGTEAVFALGLAHVLLADGLVSRADRARIVDLEDAEGPGYVGLVGAFTPRHVGAVSGVDPGVVRATARELAARQPALAVGGGDPGGGPLGDGEERAIWGLNLLLGSVGRSGGVVLRRNPAAAPGWAAASAPASLAEVPDGSLDLVFVDGSVPGPAFPRDLLRRKLSGPDALVVGLSPWVAGPTEEADFILPTAAPGEWLDDVPARALAPRNSYALAPAVTAAPPWTRHPADLLDRLAAAAGMDPGPTGFRARHAGILQGRVAAIHARGRGAIHDPERQVQVPIAQLDTPAALIRLLERGGCWTEPADLAMADTPVRLLGPEGVWRPRLAALADGRLGNGRQALPLVLTVRAPQGAGGGGILPPVANKLYRESRLLPCAARAHLNPATARSLRLEDERPARLETAHGRMTVTVIQDETVQPGVISMATGPGPADLGDPDAATGDVLELCGAGRNTVWRVTAAALGEV